MAARYYVWGAGSWRELDVAAGCVAGWRRRARFVTSPVSGSKLRPRERRGLVPHCHCSAHHSGCVEPPLPAAPGRREAATQCATTERSLNINMPPVPARPAPAPAPAPAPPAPRTAPLPPPAQFPRLGGRARTWHSLRNRYLRYILPALAALRLPPAHESRLRAAAATGVTKANKGKRRNSIFKEAERGASSVRPRPPPSPPTPVAAPAAAASPRKAQAAPAAVTTIKKEVQTESRTLRRSPRYSEVTRQFAARHAPRAASSTDSSSDSSPAPSPTRGGTTPSPRGGRSRRLFNPNRNV
ncbi:hypothetical protein B5X24_HaOG212424 [Helicoverpa armigera]|uniref:Uncharacterized protein n=1 Tax=Helicoverpa armigera TaxID=29058 RepID=A0A2W1B986_HELAM|nr:hypothetical protein B5X24_HaOG212424 [Helicoverpa armigera]